MGTHESRVRQLNDRPTNHDGDYVLYWCQMFRRLNHNHALDYAMQMARELKKPLVVFEALKLNYPWASARFHQFILEGMQENHRIAKDAKCNYWPFVETAKVKGHGLVQKLCKKACLLVTDDYPQFIVPAHNRAISTQVDIPVTAIDGNSMVPLSLLGDATKRAFSLRGRIHKQFAEAWQHRAIAEPEFDLTLTQTIDPPFKLWEPPIDLAAWVKQLPIDQSVPAVPNAVGGHMAAKNTLNHFLKHDLERYADERNQPDDPERGPSSRLSWYLHYGHISIQEIVEAVLNAEGKWSPKQLGKANNKDDFFSNDPNINSFLDEAITWRDVGYQWNYAQNVAIDNDAPHKSWQDNDEAMPAFNFETYDFSPLSKDGTLATVLPDWAKESIGKHAKDRRPTLYSLEELEHAATDDELWNAAQREMVATGRMHNYMRMLWGKKILEWSPTAEEGYRIMEHLNNKYELDGRDPNSYTGFFWVYGMFDRAWADRDIYGKLRYMTTDSAKRKFNLNSYFEYVNSLPHEPDA